MTSHMTSYVENKAQYEKYDIFRMFYGHVEQLMIIFNLKKLVQCLKQQSSDKITENQQYGVHK